jgi:RNA polymerase sigma-70 factor (ECF subfamily)
MTDHRDGPAPRAPRRPARRGIDRQVAAAATAGDRDAFVSVLRHYDGALRVIAWHILGDRHEMDDALQEVALRAWRGRTGFRGEASLGTWLSRIAYNVCWNLLSRRQRREAAVSLYDESAELAGERCGTAGEDIADTVASRDALSTAFATLSPEQRLTVLLIDREGYDYTTTGAIMGVPTGTVASRLSSGRDTLRRALSSSTPEEVQR